VPKEGAEEIPILEGIRRREPSKPDVLSRLLLIGLIQGLFEISDCRFQINLKYGIWNLKLASKKQP